MHSFSEYQNAISESLGQAMESRKPDNLYDPIRYILSLGGKRLRPVLTLLSAEIFGADFKQAIPAAIAVEVFHNFSLVHDDIMDDAPLRRGHQTVHEKWDTNTAILSGDAMLILAYRYFESYEPEIFRSLAKLFSKTALEVCEGQQLDVDFELLDNVTIDQYIEMIRLKTAVLVAAALQMGAMIAKTSAQNCDAIYDFGMNLGIAFQIQDDYLDAFGDPETFGKQVGGDIIENKKTFLYLKAVELAGLAKVSEIYHANLNDADKVEHAKLLFTESGVGETATKSIADYTAKAISSLDRMDISDDRKQILRDFGTALMNRNV